MATDAISNDPIEAIPVEMRPVVDHLVTEDDVPVDNVFSEKQQRLLTEPLFSSWPGPGEQRPFVAMANVGLFYATRRPPLVPDALLSLDVEMHADVWVKSNRSYFVWEYGKAPEVVIEVVSNRAGGEDTDKLAAYARIGIRYYVIYDPEQMLGAEELRVFRLEALQFHRVAEPIWFPDVRLGLSLWQGRYEDLDYTWLRWIDATGKPVPTGNERAAVEREHAEEQQQIAEAEHERAEAEHERAEAECQRAETERQRADDERRRGEQLAEQLRKLGVEPR
jgi:hypothetical protein